MKYIIQTIIAMVLSFSAMGQIAPYQIINDVDGEHRILMTDANGEYIRVGLLDAVIDSIGIQLEQVGDSICIVGGNCIFNPTGGSQLTEAQVDAYADNNGYLEVEIDGSTTNELQTLTDSGATFTLSNGGGTVTKTVNTDTQLSDGDIAAFGYVKTDNDTQLTEAQVDAYADNNGYLETEVDGSTTNEIQTITKVGSTVTLSNSGGSFTDEVDDNDNNAYNEGEITFENIATANEVGIRSNTNYSKVLTLKGEDGITIDHSTNKFTFGLDATAVNDADSDPTNEIQDTTEIVGLLEFVQNNSASGGKFVDGTTATDAVFTGGAVGIGTTNPQALLDVSGSVYIGDDAEINGYVTLNDDIEIQGSMEIEGGISSNGTFYIDGTSSFNDDAQFDGDMTSTATINADIIKVTDRVGGAAVKGAFFDANNQLVEGTIITDTNTQLTEAQVDAYADNNGYLESEVDGSITNEIQTISKAGTTVTLSNSGGSFTDAVDDADNDPTNEIQDTTEIVGLLEFVQNNSTGGAGGKFVDGTDTDDAVYTTGDVGIGTDNPIAKLYVDGGALGGTAGNDVALLSLKTTNTNTDVLQFTSERLTTGTNFLSAAQRIQRKVDATLMGYIQFGAHTDDLITFGENNTERMRIDGDGNVGINNTNPQAKIHIDGQQILTNTNGTEGASLFLGRSGNVSQAAEINFVENSSASYAYGFRFRLDGAGNKLYLESNNGSSGSPSYFDLMAFNRAGGVEVENSLSVNGTYFGEYPKDSGLDNVVMGSGNATSMTAGQYSIISGKFNARDATTIAYSNISGINNVDDATSVNYVFANGAYNNQFNSGSSSYNFFNGYLNARDAQGTLYSFLNGRENAEDAASVSYSFYNGFKNLHAGTGSALYNFFNGRENAALAVDADYSFLAGFRNVYTGAADLDYAFITGVENAYNAASSMVSTNIMGSRNAYTTTGNLNYFTSIGYENGKLPTVALNNTILLGFRQGYSVGSEGAAAYRLAIGMYQDNPLIYGEFDNEVLKVNGNLTVTDRAGTPDKGATFDSAGKLVESDLFIAGYGGLERNSIDVVVSTVAAVEVDFNVNFGSTNTTVSTTDESITVTKGGYWKVTVDGEIERYIAYDEFKVSVRNNGNSEHTFETHAGADDFSFNFSAVLDLDDGDEITIYLDSDLDTDYDYKRIQFTLHRIANN